MREIKKIDKNSREECLKFELQIAKERIEELETKLHIVLEDNKSMYNTVYHMPDPHKLLEIIGNHQIQMKTWYDLLSCSGINSKERVRNNIKRLLKKEGVWNE